MANDAPSALAAWQTPADAGKGRDGQPDEGQPNEGQPNEGGPSLSDLPNLADLVAEHHAELYRYACRLTGSSADAEDLSQQVFLVAHMKLDQLRDPEKARGWLFAILRNSFLKLRRKKSPTPAASLQLDVDDVPADGGPAEGLADPGLADPGLADPGLADPGLADDAPEEIDPQRLQAALDELPEDYRIVLLMFYFEDCSYREIAQRLGIPNGTVMSRLSRAKSRLRARLSGREAGRPGEPRRQPK